MNSTMGDLSIRHGAMQHCVSFSEIEFAYLVLIGQGKSTEAATRACISSNYSPNTFEEQALTRSVYIKCKQIEAAWKAARQIG